MVLRLKPSDIDNADNWFDTKGNKTVFFCRFIPLVRSLISIPAGMSEMDMKKFILYTFCGSICWNFVLTFVGSKVGQNWTKIVKVLDTYSHVAIVILILIFIGFIFMFYRKKK